MDCPRCKLINPPEAQRCDCGYDFEKKILETPYFVQGVPRGVKSAGVVLIVWALLGLALGMAGGDAVRVVSSMVWVAVLVMLYLQLLERKEWARKALVVLTFPIGFAIFTTPDLRLYCHQKH